MEGSGNESDQSCASTVVLSDSDIYFDDDEHKNNSVFPTCKYEDSQIIIQEIVSHLSIPNQLPPIIIGQHMDPNHLIESDDNFLKYHTICKYRHKLNLTIIRLKEYHSDITKITSSDIIYTRLSSEIEFHKGSIVNFEKKEFNPYIYIPATHIKYIAWSTFKYIDDISAWVLIDKTHIPQWLTFNNEVIILNFNDYQ